LSAYFLSRRAKRDLVDIWKYIARDSPDAADRWTSKLLDSFDLLARNPNVGHRRSELTTRRVRFWDVGRYVVVYRAEAVPLDSCASCMGRKSRNHSYSGG